MKSLTLCLLWVACIPEGITQIVKLDLHHPPSQVQIFGEAFVSTQLNERDFAVSPSGEEIFYTISLPRFTLQTIVRCLKLGDGNWSEPEVAPFSGRFSDLEATFSADGKTIFFASNRPLEGHSPKDYDIWRVERTETGWGEPVNLGNVVNTEGNEFYPSVAQSGNLYFTATRDHGVGAEDIFISRHENGRYLPPEPLDTAINSKMYEFNAYVSPDEQFIIFSSYGRKDDMGGGDLYMSVKDDKGNWKPAVNLQMLNSSSLDYCPFVSSDGQSLFFTSERHALPSKVDIPARLKDLKEYALQVLNGGGNIYWIDFARVKQFIE